MARHKHSQSSNAQLRAYLRAEERHLFDIIAAAVPDLPSPSTSALVTGGAYRFPRRDLPEWHPSSKVGDGGDELEVGADDMLRLVV